MKTVEIRAKGEESKFPIQISSELNIYSNYFLVRKKDKEIFLLRHCKETNKWFFVSLDDNFIAELKYSLDVICSDYYVFCIPEYTGDCAGSQKDEEETKIARKELLLFLIGKYF